MESVKDFDSWNESKKKIHTRQELPQFSEYEIWWCSYGLNIGYEVDGKNELFERPVIVYKKHNKFTFLGIPTTTKYKRNKWFIVLMNSGVEFILNFSQLKTFSTARLLRRMGMLSDSNQRFIKNEFSNLFCHESEIPLSGEISGANCELINTVYYKGSTMQIPQNIQTVMSELLSLCNSESWNYEYQTDFLQHEKVKVSSEEKILPWNISPETGKYLFDLVVKHKPTKILELGTSTGYSTLWLGAAAQSYGGTIDTVDYYDRKIEIAKKYIQKAGLENVATIHHARIATFLESVKSEEYSFVFLDADKNNYHNYLPELLRVMKPRSILVVDNAINYRERMKEFVMMCESSNNLKVELLEVGTGLLFVSKQN